MEQYAATPVGLEGVVVKALAESYRGGRRGWLKVRVRDTAEVVLAAETGQNDGAGTLVVGLSDQTGVLVVAGSTSAPHHARQRTAVAPFLRAQTHEHPWPPELPAGRMGSFGGGRIQVSLVEPLVIEVVADTAFEHGRWRHLTRFLRVCADLAPAEVAGPGRRR